jgi:hypothetical protein
MNPTCSAYHLCPQLLINIPHHVASHAGILPFTGLDLVLLIGIATLMFLAGLILTQYAKRLN